MFNSTDKFLMIGRSGCGKSYLAKHLQRIYPRRIIFDSLDEYNPSQFRKPPIVVTNFEGFANAISQVENEKKFIIIYKIDVTDDLAITYFNHSMEILYELGDVCVVIEEIQDYCSPYKIPPFLKKGMTSGRHRNMSFFMTTQRPSFIHGDIFSQATNTFCGNLIKKSDAQTMADLLNVDRKEIHLLKKREFFWFNSEREIPVIKINSEQFTKKA